MANPATGVTVYWIERSTTEVCSHYFASPLPSGHSYEGEVRIKHALNAVELVVIPLASAGTDWAKAARARLHAKAAELHPDCVA